MKVKKCPACGTINRINNIICEGCAEDLLRVPVSEGESLPVQEKNTDTPVFGRKCTRCGKIQPYQKSRCECGMLLLICPPYPAGNDENTADSLTDAISEPLLSKQILFTLRSEDGRCEIPLYLKDNLTLGRKETGAEYLSDKSFVSSRHARIRITDGGVLLEHIGSTNPTLVNGKEIMPNVPILLEPGDLVVFGAREGQDYCNQAAYFRLRK